MKNIQLILVLILTMTLAACNPAAKTESIPTVALDAPAQTGNSSSGIVTASAEVVPVNKVELSFPLMGMIESVDVKVGDKVSAGQSLATLNTALLDAKVAEAEANVAAAEAQVRYLTRIGTDDEHLASAKADIDRAQAALDMAKATLGQATLITPIGGTVTDVKLSVGETAMPGLVVVVIGDLSNMRIETTDLSETDVPSVKIGQTANVFIKALNETFTGKVVDIARQSETVGGDTVFKVTIELDDQPQGLYWGMSADVEIQTEK